MSPKLSTESNVTGAWLGILGCPCFPPPPCMGHPFFLSAKKLENWNPMPTLKSSENSLPLNNALPGRLISKFFRENQLLRVLKVHFVSGSSIRQTSVYIDNPFWHVTHLCSYFVGLSLPHAYCSTEKVSLLVKYGMDLNLLSTMAYKGVIHMEGRVLSSEFHFWVHWSHDTCLLRVFTIFYRNVTFWYHKEITANLIFNTFLQYPVFCLSFQLFALRSDMFLGAQFRMT